jgi:hypothetical protein
MANVIIEQGKQIKHLTDGLNEAFSIIRQLDAVVGTYVEFNKHGDAFNEYIIKRREEIGKINDAKADGEADKPNLQGDTDGESSGSEGVREKE